MKLLGFLRMCAALFARGILAAFPSRGACRIIRFLSFRLPWAWGNSAIFHLSPYVDGHHPPFVEAPTKSGFRMHLDLRDRWIQRYIYFLGTWDRDSTKIVHSVLRDGDVFFDVGANVGYFTLMAAKLVGPRGRVYAFEPEPELYSQLSRNVTLNGMKNVELANVAVTDRSGKILIENVAYIGNRGAASLVPRQPGMPMIEVNAISLDEFSRMHGIARIRLIKMDIEGAEMLALQGMIGLLSAPTVPDLLCEVDDRLLRRMGFRDEDVYSLLSSLGFKRYAITPKGLEEVEPGLNPGENLYFSKRLTAELLVHQV